MPLDPRLVGPLAMLPAPPSRDLSAAERRALVHERWAATAAPKSPLHEVTDRQVGAVPIRVYRPAPGLLPAILYFHGGGWWLGGLEDSDEGCRQRARLLGCVVISVDYRLAPENPFPAGLDDCTEAARWLFESADELGIDPSRVIIAGGSAGANLAAAVTLRARDLPFAAQILEIPGMDLTLENGGRSIDEYAEGYVLSRTDLVECTQWYYGDHDPTDPLVSPLFGDLRNVPPALVTTCECDPVRDDGRAYAAKLRAAGVDTTHLEFEGQVHGSYGMAALVPDVAARWLEALVAFVGRHTGLEAASSRDQMQPIEEGTP